MAGLDPAIHLLRKNFSPRMMDPRVKPAGDDAVRVRRHGASEDARERAYAPAKLFAYIVFAAATS